MTQPWVGFGRKFKTRTQLDFMAAESWAQRLFLQCTLLLLLLPRVACFSVPLAMAMRGRAQGDVVRGEDGLNFLDETGGLWQLPRALVPLPHERLRIAQAVEAAHVPRASNCESGTLTAQEAHSTFLPLRQALAELEAEAACGEKRCLIGINEMRGAVAADFSRILAAVLDTGDAGESRQCLERAAASFSHVGSRRVPLGASC